MKSRSHASLLPINHKRNHGARQSRSASVPADVWSVILAYAYDSEIWFSDAPLSFRPGLVPPSGYWLLCRSLSEGLNLRIWSALSDEVKRTKGVLRLPGGSLTPGVRGQWMSYSHKRVLCALLAAPALFLSTIRSIQGPVIGLDDVVHLLHMDHLEVISGPFIGRSQDFGWLQRVDLRHLASLTELGTDFLSFCCVEEILLPDSLERVGDRFLTGTRIKALDLSMTRITQVGDEFLKGTPLTNIQFPRTLRRVGHEFLAACPYQRPTAFDSPPQGIAPFPIHDTHAIGLQVDLTQTALESVGNHFLADSSVQWIRFPRSLKRVGTYFLLKYSGKWLDLSHTTLESVGDGFLSHSQVEELILPASLKEVGAFFLEHFRGRHLNLSHTALKEFGYGFLSESIVEELFLPSTVRSVSTPDFLRNHRGRLLNLHSSALTSAGDQFLSGSRLEKLVLPRSLKFVRDFFFHQHPMKRVDLSQCCFEQVGCWFLAYSQVEYLFLPPTLTAVGDCFLTGFKGTRLDLSRTRLQVVGPRFLCESRIDELLLPATLKHMQQVAPNSIFETARFV
jgi:hypothetical protein